MKKINFSTWINSERAAWDTEGDVFNIRRPKQWAFADDLGVHPKDPADPERISLAVLIIRQETRPSFCQSTPRGFIDKELGKYCIHDGFYMYLATLGGL